MHSWDDDAAWWPKIDDKVIPLEIPSGFEGRSVKYGGEYVIIKLGNGANIEIFCGAVILLWEIVAINETLFGIRECLSER